ncbi:hypothetical protein [Parachlamydia sp. AcF125]|uniref:hypothetical protein n=1 Tax=Parachlamydia sp. AcF125 TaxID=2795736 RepID=UPI001BC8FB4D|nr:hypothetical protein [Parachlamydia sp. AcF125]MBS4168144.1 hypothetical protein [Parachlamydia sp. AcF125]
MQCSSKPHNFVDGNYDTFIHNYEKGNSKTEGEHKVCLIAAAAFSDMYLDNKSATIMSYHHNMPYYSGALPVSILTHSGITDVGNALQARYALLRVRNGDCTLTVSQENYVALTRDAAHKNTLKKVRVVFYYNLKCLEAKKKKFLGSMEISSFSSDDEYIYHYCQAAHRAQKIIGGAIFKQTRTQLIPRGKNLSAGKRVKKFFSNVLERIDDGADNALSHAVYVPNSYRTDLPYDIEKNISLPEEQKRLSGEFIDLPFYIPRDVEFDSDSSLSDSSELEITNHEEISESPTALGSHRGSSASYSHAPAQKLPITSFFECVEKITSSLAKKGFNWDSNGKKGEKFNISMHFRRPQGHPDGVLLNTWMAENPREESVMRGATAYYGVPFDVEIAFADGTRKQFKYIYRSSVEVPIGQPKKVYASEAGVVAAKYAPKTPQEARESSKYKAYLEALGIRHAIKISLNGGSDKSVEARNKLREILDKGYCFDFTAHNTFTDPTYIDGYETESFKKKSLLCLSVGTSFKDRNGIKLNLIRTFYEVRGAEPKRFLRVPKEQVKAAKKLKKKLIRGTEKTSLIHLAMDYAES